ncbi:hypothetical protein IW262DRAFT_952513 [Armillaria fumosa]|nr:hypothetical protein IW262DRAFT_952513 [Armillaria fumosa]
MDLLVVIGVSRFRSDFFPALPVLCFIAFSYVLQECTQVMGEVNTAGVVPFIPALILFYFPPAVSIERRHFLSLEPCPRFQSDLFMDADSVCL